MEMSKRSRGEYLRGGGFALVLFLSAFAFHRMLYPIVIFNMDDWLYLVLRRLPFPQWRGWNPTRVLPELLMPLTAQAAARLIFPLTGDLIDAIEIGMALVVSGFTALYACCCLFWLRRRLGVSEARGYGLTLLFLLLHLLVFKNQAKGIDHLLSGYYDATTYFFYLIPALWNASLVLYLHASRYFSTRRGKPWPVRLLVCAACYFALLSNLYQSVILAVYAALHLLHHLIRARQRGRLRWGRILPQLLILAAWAAVQVFEYFGGRADSLAGAGLGASLAQTGSLLLERLGSVNRLFALLLAAAVILLLVGWKSTPAPERRRLFRFLTAGGLTLLYEGLLCAASVPSYIRRGDVLISVFFYLFLFLMGVLALWLRRVKKSGLILPGLLLACALAVGLHAPSYRTRINAGLSPDTARAITRDIVAQVAAIDGQEERPQVLVPRFGSADNWPLALYGSPRVAQTLYAYGVIPDCPDFDFVVSESKNAEFGL